MEEEAIKMAKFMTKEQACLLPKTSTKFNSTWIQLASNGDITLCQETCIGGISVIKDHENSINSLRGLVQTNLFPRKRYIAQRVRKAHLVFICQPKTSFDLFYAAQSTKFSPENIAALNKQL